MPQESQLFDCKISRRNGNFKKYVCQNIVVMETSGHVDINTSFVNRRV